MKIITIIKMDTLDHSIILREFRETLFNIQLINIGDKVPGICARKDCRNLVSFTYQKDELRKKCLNCE